MKDLYFAMLGADKAWEKYTGKGIKVGIIDTGIDYSHSDLAPNIAKYKSFIDDTDGVDANFHGTHVAGISCGRNNGTGIVGVAPEAKIYSAKIFDKNSKTTATAEMKALEWMAGEGVHVVNMSYGGLFPIDIPGVKESLQKYHDCVKAVADAGVIMVAAAGNAGTPKDTLDRNFVAGTFSRNLCSRSYLPRIAKSRFSSAGDMLDFAMPGVDVYSCYPGNKWARYSGTSHGCTFLNRLYSLTTRICT